ncbi:MAG: GspE/PulE family protein [Candidatus Saccharibacteria bacterium]|nr:GspE/PulE family protein [Candidatus Saccharibacteria bacterium]
MQISDKQLVKLISELDYVSADDLKKAQDNATTSGISLYESLQRSELMTDENLGKLIAYSYKLPFITLGQLNIPEEILKITPKETAEKFRVITFELKDGELKIGTSEPDNQTLFANLTKKAGAEKFRLYYVTEQDVSSTLRLYKEKMQSVFKDMLQQKGQGGDLPVAHIVETIIEYAFTNQASDIHVEPTREESYVRFRIDGVLHDVVKLPRRLHDQVVTRIKVLARLRTDEHFSAQDGRTRVTVDEKDVDIRVSIVPVIGGEKAVLRLLASHMRQFGLTDLGMQEADLKKVRDGFAKPYGMVLSTGPTGSGKTTSMYAILKILNVREKNIATIEDPVEYELKGVNQIQANPKANLSFANGLRSILRQDPDIIYVGEIRDEETANIAINSAMTGHLVLSTMHTNDAATTLPRLIDMKIEPFLAATSVNVIIAQRLVRKICDRCKASLELTRTKTGWSGDDVSAKQLAALDPATVSRHFGATGSVRVYRGKGCGACHETGYSGRVGVFEVLEVSPAIQKLITDKASSEAITAAAVKEGMTTMMDDGMKKVRSGITTLEEILRATRA